MGSVSAATSFWWGVCRQRDRVLLITNFYKILGGAFPPPPHYSFIISPPPQAVQGGVTAQGRSLAIRPPPNTSNGTWSCSCCSSPFPSPVYIRHSCSKTEMFSSYFKLFLLFLKQTKKNYKRNHGNCLQVPWAQLHNLGLDLLKAYA